MKTYLLTWNPDLWDWSDLSHLLDQVKVGQKASCQWAAGEGRGMRPGDRIYFIQYRREPKGLFGAGKVTRVPREESNINVEGSVPGKRVLVVDVDIEDLVDPRNMVILDMSALRVSPFNKIRWETPSSGVLVKPQVADHLQKIWRLKLGKSAGQDLDKLKGDSADVENNGNASNENEVQAQMKDDAKNVGKQRDTDVAISDMNADSAEVDPARYAIVSAYFDQLFKDVTGQVFRRRDILAEYAEQLEKLEKGKLDRYFCHVSALLAELGLPFMTESQPWAGASHALQDALHNYLAENIEKLSNFRRVALHCKEAPPTEIPDSRVCWVAPPEPSSYRYSGIPEKLQNLSDVLDFLTAETVDQVLHERAVEFVLAYEKARLREGGQSELGNKIERLDSASRETGCDILSFDTDGEARCILVKPTHFGKHFPFILFNDEIEDLRRGEAEHYIYRPFNLAYEYKLFVLKEGLSDMEQSGFDAKENTIRLITYDRIVFGWPKLIKDEVLGNRFGFIYRT